MKLSLKFILCLLSATQFINCAPTPPNPSDDEEYFDEEADDPNQVLLGLDFETKSNLAMFFSQTRSRDELQAILQRTIDMMQHRPLPERSRRYETYNSTAKALGRALLNDPRFGSTSDESECYPHFSSQEEYCDPPVEACAAMTIATMKKIIKLKDKGRSNASLKKLYPKYRKDQYGHYKRCVEAGSSVLNTIRRVNAGVLSRIASHREAGLPVHGYNIRRWGMELANDYNISRQFFRASPTWLYKLKKTGRIGSRKVTEYISRSENNQQDIIDCRIDQFLSDYERISPHFSRRLIINMDQTGFDYEITNQRTLSYIGERDTRLNVDQKNKISHSFTAQPMITRDGKTFGKLLLVLQENTKNETFGPRILPQVQELERRYGDIRVYASKSGKLSANLIRDWIHEVFKPAVRATLTSIDTDTDLGSELETMSMDDEAFEDPPLRQEPLDERLCFPVLARRRPSKCYKKPHTLLLADAWAGQTRALEEEEDSSRGIEYLEIPKLTTKYIQPLDMGFNLQYKKFVKRIFEAALDPESGVPIGEITSRSGVINTHSLVWNQFASENYTDLIRYAWHNTDTHWSADELSRPPPPRTVIKIQFDFPETKCQHPNCSRSAFIRCSHCGKILCAKHFLERVCFHEHNEQRAGPSAANQPGHSHAHDSEDDDFDPDLFSRRTTRAPTTTTPYSHDELRLRRSVELVHA